MCSVGLSGMTDGSVLVMNHLVGVFILGGPLWDS